MILWQDTGRRLACIAVLLSLVTPVFANNLAPFPLLQFHPYWNWDFEPSLFVWAAFNVLFCMLSEWLIYLHSQKIRRPLQSSLIANAITTATGMMIGMVGIALMAIDLDFLTLLLPIAATLVTEHLVIRRFKRPEISEWHCFLLVVRANVLSNLIMYVLIGLKAHR